MSDSGDNTSGQKNVDVNAPLVPKVPPPAPPAPAAAQPSTTTQGAPAKSSGDGSSGAGQGAPRKRSRGPRKKSGGGGGNQRSGGGNASNANKASESQGDQSGQNQSGQNQSGQKQGNRPSKNQRRRQPSKKKPTASPIEAVLTDDDGPVELDENSMKKRRGRQRKGKAVGRYQMNVHVDGVGHTHIATLEGRSLIEHYVARPSDDVSQIHGNIYLGRIENVLPGMEAAFVDIATPKNAVLYRGDVRLDPDDIETKGSQPRIEDMLKARQLVICQVTKNPIAHKGARLTQEVSLPGRFVVLVPNSTTYGISKRLPDKERKRLRAILDKAKPDHHGVIVRTAAENVTAEEIERDVGRLLTQWEQIEQLAKKQNRPTLLYREPDMSVRVIREEFNTEYRSIVIDNEDLYNDVLEYVSTVTPALVDRVQYYDQEAEQLPLFERYQIAEQLTKAVDRKVWLPGGGSLIIEHTEALTVIDVNTGRNVGSSSLEETVFANNLEAAEEIARQLRLRDIGGIIVVDFVDMEVKSNRDMLVKTFRDALARDKTRTQVFNVSDLGLVEMTRKRIGEGLLESFADMCDACEGRGVVMTSPLLAGKMNKDS